MRFASLLKTGVILAGGIIAMVGLAATEGGELTIIISRRSCMKLQPVVGLM
jgi:molybdopterin-binding protein